MVPSGQPNSNGGSHSGSHALLRVNSGLLGSQGASMPPQGTFSSLVSPRSQYNVNLLESSANVSSLLNHNFENESSATSLSGLSRFQAGSVDTMAESNPMSVVANDVGFTSSLKHANSVNSTSSGQAYNQQIQHPSGSSSLSDQQQSQLSQFEPQKFQHGQQLIQHLSVSQNHMQQQQPHFQSLRGGLGALAPVKLEPQGMSDNISLPQKLPALQSLAPVKLEQQKNQMNRSLGPVKLENQVSDQAAILQNQRQQQLLHMSRQSSQAAVAQMNYIQQQRILHMQQQQQQQQQQLLRALPQQQSQLLQQFQQQNLPIRSPVRQVYEPGTCARRLTQYMYQQQHRPNDNNIEFWRKFVTEFFAPNARKRWCVSLYGNTRQTSGVFPQDLWQCEICNRKPGRGFETTFEVLPRLFKIKYDSGTLEELLYVDMPREYQNANGQIVLDYAKAIQESVFEHLRVVRDGQLRIVFSPDLKICSWEFCAKHHEELIPRRLIIPQVSQLGAAAQKYQASAQSSPANSQKTDLESNCNMFLASARQLAKALEVPLVNELGYSKRYIRCLQISEVVNSMKDLIDFSRQTGKGPIESLANFPSKKRSFSEMNNPVEQPEKQQLAGQAQNNDHNSAHVGAVHPSMSNANASANNSNGTIPIATSTGSGAGLMHQSSMNSQIDNQMNNPSSPYTGTPVQIPSAGSSSNLPPAQPSTSSPFSSPTPSSSNNLNQGSHAAATTINHVNSTNSSVQMSMRNPSQSNELDPNESQSSVEKIIQEIMITSQFTGADSMVGVDSRISNIKSINGVQQPSRNMLGNGNSMMGSGNVIDNSGKVGGRNGLTGNAGGVMAAMESNFESLTGRVGRSMMHPGASMSHQQQELSNRLLNGLGANNFYDQFTWRSP